MVTSWRVNLTIGYLCVMRTQYTINSYYKYSCRKIRFIRYVCMYIIATVAFVVCLFFFVNQIANSPSNNKHDGSDKWYCDKASNDAYCNNAERMGTVCLNLCSNTLACSKESCFNLQIMSKKSSAIKTFLCWQVWTLETNGYEISTQHVQ